MFEDIAGDTRTTSPCGRLFVMTISLAFTNNPSDPPVTFDGNTPPLSDAERIAYYDRHLRELGADPATLSEETDATLEDTLAWLRGEAPCPVHE
jgi:hypothetical protein